MNFDSLTAGKTPAAGPSRIDEIAARIAQIKADYGKLDETSTRLGTIIRTAREPAGGSELIYLEREMVKLEREGHILELMLNICEPRTSRDVLVMLSSGYRLDAIETKRKRQGRHFRARLHA